jgi:hypothetical protein
MLRKTLTNPNLLTTPGPLTQFFGPNPKINSKTNISLLHPSSPKRFSTWTDPSQEKTSLVNSDYHFTQQLKKCHNHQTAIDYFLTNAQKVSKRHAIYSYAILIKRFKKLMHKIPKKTTLFGTIFAVRNSGPVLSYTEHENLMFS